MHVHILSDGGGMEENPAEKVAIPALATTVNTANQPKEKEVRLLKKCLKESDNKCHKTCQYWHFRDGEKVLLKV